MPKQLAAHLKALEEKAVTLAKSGQGLSLAPPSNEFNREKELPKLLEKYNAIQTELKKLNEEFNAEPNTKENRKRLQKDMKELDAKNQSLEILLTTQHRVVIGGGSVVHLGQHLAATLPKKNVDIAGSAASALLLKNKGITSKFHHTNIAQLHESNVSSTTSSSFAVSVARTLSSDLHDLLQTIHSNKKLSRAAVVSLPESKITSLSSSEEIPLPIALSMIAQCALALHALHTKNIAHRDISSYNFFLELNALAPTQPPHVYLADMNTLIEVDEKGHSASPVFHVFNPSYKAPELDKEKQSTSETNFFAIDIYSLGRVFKDILAATSQADIPPELSILANNMTQTNPGERPTIDQVMNTAIIRDAANKANEEFDFPTTPDGQYVLSTSTAPGVADLFFPPIVRTAYQEAQRFNAVLDNPPNDSQHWYFLGRKVFAAKLAVDSALRSEESKPYLAELNKLSKVINEQTKIICSNINKPIVSSRLFGTPQPQQVPVKFTSARSMNVIPLLALFYNKLEIPEFPQVAIKTFFNAAFEKTPSEQRLQALNILLFHPTILSNPVHKQMVRDWVMTAYHQKFLSFDLKPTPNEPEVELSARELVFFLNQYIPKHYANLSSTQKRELHSRVLVLARIEPETQYMINRKFYELAIGTMPSDLRHSIPEWKIATGEVDIFFDPPAAYRGESKQKNTSVSSPTQILDTLRELINNYALELDDLAPIEKLLNIFKAPLAEQKKIENISQELTPEFRKKIIAQKNGKTFLNKIDEQLKSFKENFQISTPVQTSSSSSSSSTIPIRRRY